MVEASHKLYVKKAVPASAWRACLQVLRRDLLLSLRRRSEFSNPLFFYVIVVSLFPLAISPAPKTLQMIAPGVIWVAALLATLLALEHLFRSDYDDGSLEQLVLSPHPLAALVFAKVVAHWLVTGLPLLLLTPMLAMFLHLSAQQTSILLLTLFLGTPTLSLLGAVGAALTVGLRNRGLLLALLILPLYIPVLIFAVASVVNAGVGVVVTGQLAVLGALCVLALCLTPVTTAAALKVTLT